jgi:NAD-dependent deacetylase
MSEIQEAAQLLKDIKHLAVLTGAGISKESGLATFRDPDDGLWSQFSPQELANAQAFHQDPVKIWNWYAQRRRKAAQAKPNPGHEALVQMESIFESVVIITQNVDGLHQAAGSHHVIELHGNIHRNKCADGCYGNPTLVDVPLSTEENEDGLPLCPLCGAFVRPDIVWFGEMLPETALEQSFKVCNEADAMLTIGTSGDVIPASLLPRIVAKHNAPIIEINPEDTSLTSLARAVLRGPSGVLLPQLVAELR